VEEAPNSDKFFTTYGYSALDDLLCVNQGVLGAATANPSIYSCDPSKAHARSFAYDGLKRLTAATNPETGTIRYSYDPVGNLLSKTDALSVTTCFGTLSGSNCTTGYDGLNRPTVKTYSDGFTPQVNYTYDSAPYGIGRLAQVSNSASTTNYLAYDALGRIASSNQITGSTTSNFPSYQYNLAGALVSETYPSGRVIATAYDGANRPAYLKGTLGSTATPYVGSSTNWIQYWPHGVPYKAAFGNGLWRTLSSVNGHLQPTAYWDAVNDNPNQFLRIEDPNWLNGSGQNNGNLQGTTVWAGGPNQSANLPQYAESFAYDGENRLTYATDSGGWSRTFGYDQWGNMAVTLNSGVPLNVNTPTSTGLFNANNQRTGQAYFANGNLKAVQPGITLAYDAENRQTSASGYSYAYDGNGHRVTKTGGGTTTVYAYDALGQLAAEYSNAANPSHGTTYYLSYDHLGTARLITDQKANVISRHDYLPFGEEIPANTAGRNGQFGAGNDGVTQKFTGKERDSESGLDYFGARYYGSALGRFTSPDEFKGGFENLNGTPAFSPGPIGYADLTDPQTLNMYVYTRNNPLRYIDPDGHDIWDYLTGVGNAFSSDNLGGAGRTSGGNEDFRLGQTVGDAVATITGSIEVLGGGGEAVVTSPAALTGVGTLAPAAGVGVALHGAATVAVAGGHLVAAAVKASDAPGTSSSGQATDEHGNKLGPSGKPMIHETNSNTREGANNKALNEGSGTVEHTNPKVGKPHFHPADAQGNKKPTSVHHNYPDN
jgi:RHS repeat-associated protein